MSNLNAYFLLIALFGAKSLQAQTFTNIAQQQGFNFLLNSTDHWGLACSFYDFNQDGWDDLSFAKENGVQEIFLNNQGNFVLPNFSITNLGQTKHLLWVDYDNDGNLDLFLSTKFGRCRLFHNDGNFVFTDRSIQAGIGLVNAANYGASFADYDKDGDLDLYICRYSLLGDSSNVNDLNVLYNNNGDGSFSDVTSLAGVGNGVGASYQSVWFDYNQDTWPDLFIINDRFPFLNALYHNNSDGTFTNITNTAGLSMPNANPMSASVADFDNDQDLDLYISNTAITPPSDLPQVFMNGNNGSFENQADSLGLLMYNTTWGGLWFDYNNDSWQDLYVATSFLNLALAPVKNYFFKNNASYFEEDTISFISPNPSFSHAVARGDLNNDGFYDVACQNNYPYSSDLWLNSGNTNSFIKITLEGTVSNRFAIGSWIHVYANGLQQSQYSMCGENYLGQNSQHFIFGLDTDTLVDSVRIVYPSGIIDKYYNLVANTSYYFNEGETGNFDILPSGLIQICKGDSIQLSAPNFVSYLWSTGENTQSIWVDSAGTYSLSATDSFGLNHQSNVLEMEVYHLPTITDSIIGVSCFGEEDGSIALEVLNAGQDYTISWQNGMSGDSIFNLSSGSYSYLYTDVFSCQFRDSLEVESPFDLNVQIALHAQSADSLGSIELLINGGTSPYYVFLDQEPASLAINNLEAGFYSLSILDDHSCYYEIELEIPFAFDSLINAFQSIEKLEPYIIYPNPFSDFIQVKSEIPIEKVLMMNNLGVIVIEERGSLIQTEHLISGTYLLKIFSNNQLYLRKVIKI